MSWEFKILMLLWIKTDFVYNSFREQNTAPLKMENSSGDQQLTNIFLYMYFNFLKGILAARQTENYEIHPLWNNTLVYIIILKTIKFQELLEHGNVNGGRE